MTRYISRLTAQQNRESTCKTLAKIIVIATSTYRRTTRFLSLTTTTTDTIRTVALAELVLYKGLGKSLHSPVADPSLAGSN